MNSFHNAYVTLHRDKAKLDVNYLINLNISLLKYQFPLMQNINLFLIIHHLEFYS